MTEEDIEIVRLLEADDERAISLLFDHYYSYLCSVIYRVIGDSDYAEDLVQEIFMDLWRKRSTLSINTSLRAYLRRAGVNRALNFLRKQKMKFDESEDAITDLQATSYTGQDELEHSELERRIHDSIEKLPPKCRQIFGMSRFESMSYQEIADTLGISIKTVENQISKALRFLRQAVHPYITE